MNKDESKFVPLSEHLTAPYPGKNPIIKGNNIRRIQTKVINIKKEQLGGQSEIDEINDNGSRIEPIIEDNNIVGIKYKCQCGEESEIRFEFKGEETENIENEDVIEE